jgi:hypothetical protein
MVPDVSSAAQSWPVLAIVAFKDRKGVVLRKQQDAAIVARLVHQFERLRRSDAVVSDAADLEAMELPIATYVIRTGETYTLTEGVRIGTCPPSIAESINMAIRRERDGRTCEARYRLNGLRIF